MYRGQQRKNQVLATVSGPVIHSLQRNYRNTHVLTRHPRLRVIETKSSCKERRAQILSEADRAGEKLLLTLELGTSVSQPDTIRWAQGQLLPAVYTVGGPAKTAPIHAHTAPIYCLSILPLITLNGSLKLAARTRKTRPRRRVLP